MAAKDDHVINRLTHTLEVNQIAQTISKELGLNLELTEAIALGHDLGHTPFGHVGERTLNHIMTGCDKIADFNDSANENNKGFKHNLQGVRVAKDLEQSKMNITKEVLWGILYHSKLEYKECKKGNGVLCDLKHNNTKCVNKPLYHYNLGFYDEYIKDLDSINICHMIENEEKKYEDNKYQKIKGLLEYDKYKKNKEEGDEKKKLDVGEIRNIISALHYHIYDEENESSNLYNNVLLRTICDYIAGMTDKYALEEHKKLYNC